MSSNSLTRHLLLLRLRRISVVRRLFGGGDVAAVVRGPLNKTVSVGATSFVLLLLSSLRRPFSPSLLLSRRSLRPHRPPLSTLPLLFLFGSSNVVLAPQLRSSSHDWSGSRIRDDLMLRHRGDVDYARDLIKRTLTCPSCEKRLVVQAKVPGVEYCKCDVNRGGPAVGAAAESEGISWTPFLEARNIIIWRKPHEEYDGVFIYLMLRYGRFEEVTPSEFLHVQTDLSEFRLTWDKNTALCHVLEEDLDEENHSLSQICYWEMKWPRFFANRDYVCKRRTQIFEEEDVGVVYNASDVHPKAPKVSKNVRVEDFWSVFCIKPTSASWEDCGVEFCMIVFEYHNLPQYVTTKVALKVMPEYMENLRKACLKMRSIVAKRGEDRANDDEPEFRVDKPLARRLASKKRRKDDGALEEKTMKENVEEEEDVGKLTEKDTSHVNTQDAASQDKLPSQSHLGSTAATSTALPISEKVVAEGDRNTFDKEAPSPTGVRMKDAAETNKRIIISVTL